MKKLVIGNILDALKDGEWHDLNELSSREEFREVTMTKLMLQINLLAEYNFIELTKEWKGDPLRPVIATRLTSPLRTFIKKILWIERAEKHGIFKP